MGCGCAHLVSSQLLFSLQGVWKHAQVITPQKLPTAQVSAPQERPPT